MISPLSWFMVHVWLVLNGFELRCIEKHLSWDLLKLTLRSSNCYCFTCFSHLQFWVSWSIYIMKTQSKHSLASADRFMLPVFTQHSKVMTSWHTLQGEWDRFKEIKKVEISAFRRRISCHETQGQAKGRREGKKGERELPLAGAGRRLQPNGHEMEA